MRLFSPSIRFFELATRAALPAVRFINKLKALNGKNRYGLERVVHCVAFLLLFLAVHSMSFAQEGSNAGLNGTVTDLSGGRIGDAAVVAKNQATQITYPGTATTTGTYTIPSLPPGTYDISATHPGFGKSIVKDVTFHVGELLTVDLMLNVASASDTVTVSSDAQLLETGSAQINLRDWRKRN
jgi:hypothetical protein